MTAAMRSIVVIVAALVVQTSSFVVFRPVVHSSSARDVCTPSNIVSSLRAAAATMEVGQFTLDTPVEEITATESVVVHYTPPANHRLATEEQLIYSGGFNDWDGDDDPIVMPMVKQEDGRHRVTVPIPPFAKNVKFAVSDERGVHWDSGPNNEFYHIHVTNVREQDDEGTTVMYTQALDGTMTEVLRVKKRDPQELERQIEREYEETKQELSGLEEGGSLITDNLRISVREQEAVQAMRAESATLGESLGLHNMQVTEARDVYDKYDDVDGELEFSDLQTVLYDLGMVAAAKGGEEDGKMCQELIDKFVLAERPGAAKISMFEFMHIFAHLDHADVGIEMV